MAGLAGCGYQPGPGDVAWETDLRLFHATGDAYLVRNGTSAAICLDARFMVRSAGVPQVVTGIRTAMVTADGSVRWQSGVDSSVALPPALTDDAVFVVDTDGRLTSFDRREGSAAEPIPLPGEPTGLAADGRTALVSTDEGLVAFDEHGAEQWSTEQSSGAVAAADELVVAGETDGELVGREPTSGTERWRVADAAVDRPRMAVSDEYVYAASGVADGRLVALDRETGERDWVVEGIGAGHPLAVGGDLVLVSSAHTVGAYDRETGERRWESTRFGSPPAVGDEGAYGLTTDCEAFCLDPDGDVAWRSPIDAEQCGRTGARPVLLDGAVVVHAGASRVTAFRRRTGRRRSLL